MTKENSEQKVQLPKLSNEILEELGYYNREA